MRCIRVVVADRHPIVRQGLLDIFDVERDFRVVACCGDAMRSVEAIRKFLPDIAVLDSALPDMGGTEILAMMGSWDLPTRVVFFTACNEDADMETLARAGAHAVISKDIEPAILTQILRRIADNSRSAPSDSDLSPQTANNDHVLHVLTHRERQVICLVAEGMSNKEVGRQLNISDGTIKVHLHKIYQKLEVTNRTALAALAISQDKADGAQTDRDGTPFRSIFATGAGRGSGVESVAARLIYRRPRPS